jgi:MFS family permease
MYRSVCSFGVSERRSHEQGDLFNMGGRFFWASTSDFIGRKPTYFIFFSLGAVLYYLLPKTGADRPNSVILFVTISAVLLSMYGGGFATIPAYVRDLIGTPHVNSIHGRLLTAWSVAGVLGPVLVNYMRSIKSRMALTRRAPIRRFCT